LLKSLSIIIIHNHFRRSQAFLFSSQQDMLNCSTDIALSILRIFRFLEKMNKSEEEKKIISIKVK